MTSTQLNSRKALLMDRRSRHARPNMCDRCTKAIHIKNRHSSQAVDVCAYDTHKTTLISEGSTYKYLEHVETSFDAL